MSWRVFRQLCFPFAEGGCAFSTFTPSEQGRHDDESLENHKLRHGVCVGETGREKQGVPRQITASHDQWPKNFLNTAFHLKSYVSFFVSSSGFEKLRPNPCAEVNIAAARRAA